MGIEYKESNIHWNYYLAIESDFEKISRYVEFSEANNSTFSIELARIIMSSTQEIDGIMKKLCALLDSSKNPDNINQYKKIILEKSPEFINEKVEIPRFGMKSEPWINWSGEKNPDWWCANNQIKHNRTENFEKANLKNAFNSVGALLITTLYYYKSKFEVSGESMSWPELTGIIKPKASLYILNSEYYHNPGTWAGIDW